MDILRHSAPPVEWAKVLLDGAQCTPCDIDGFMERNGRFLFLEWKGLGEKPMNRGQRLAYEQLAKLPRCNVVWVRGDRDTWEVRSWQIVGVHRGPQPCDNQTLLTYVNNFLDNNRRATG